MKATVYKSTGSWYILKDDAGITYNARLKGIFKIDGLGSTNPIAVGDTVTAEMENEGESTVTITDIGKRKNYLTRQSPANKNLHHIIASNLDQSLLFATLKDPKTSQGFIDRFLISSESFHLPAIIVFNKSDLHGRKEEEKFEGLKEMYEAIGYHVKKISVEKNQGLEDLSQMLKDKVTLISGHSGVGKSSFLNKIFPHINLKTQDVSDWSGKGMHTTTFAEMFDLPFGGKIIDTPGIRELGLVDISKQELSHYYPEMRLLLNNCQYNDCLHINEPNCAVKQAVESGKISPDRYISYRKIFDSIEENKY
jgi:ribosome biogenesis GTPase